MKLTTTKNTLTLAGALFLFSCGSSSNYAGLSGWSSHVPKSSGTFKIGNPYKVAGKTYYPKESYDYSESGIASWYGPIFHGKLTANGETYDQYALTAAHKTLQIPSILRVTNLENGRSIIVRVNDRGPYSKGRIIDMSKRGAELLGFINKGTAKVRLQVMKKESRLVAEAAKRNQNVSGIEIALNQGKTAEEFLGISAPETLSQTVKVDSLSAEDKTIPTDLKNQDLSHRLSEEQSGLVVKEVPTIKDLQTMDTKQKTDNVTAMPTAIAPLSLESANLTPMPNSVTPQTTKQIVSNLVKNVPVPTTHIYVQTASFSNQQSAINYAKSLSQFGTTDIKEISVNNNLFYRVRIGPLDSVPQADSLLNQLSQSGKTDAIITVGK